MTSIGIDFVRPDAAAKTRGETIFSSDYSVSGMLYGVILRSPVAAGRIVGLDLSRARVMPGVRAVICHADVPKVLAGWIIRDTPMFARDVVRYVGEPVAAVAADSLDEARRARDAIVLQIEEWTPCVTMQAAVAPGARLIHPDLQSYRLADDALPPFPRYANIASESVTLADPKLLEAAFTQAAFVVEDEFTTQRQYQGYLEPKNALGIFHEGRYIAHVGSQFPYNVRTRLSQYFNVPAAKIRVIGHPFGGGFGGKLDACLEPHAIALSKAAGGRAVKIVNARDEDIVTSNSRESTVIRMRSAIDENGEIIARDVECLLDNGAYTGELASLACFPFHILGINYRIGLYRAAGRLVYTNTAPTAAMRGVSGVPLYAALELHMDSIAARLGVDRREYRLRHIFTSGDRLPNGQVLSDAKIFKEQFGSVEAVVPWKNGNGKKQYRGRAISPAVWLVNPLPGTATAKLQEDGSVVLITAANENGTGSVATAFRQIVAEELGIDPDNVIIPDPDTDIGAFDAGSQGSRNTHVSGGAAQMASRQLGAEIKKAAAVLLQAQPGDLELADGFVRVRACPKRRVSFSAVWEASTHGTGTLVGSGSWSLMNAPAFNPGCASGLLFAFFASPTYHVHYCEVEVDPTTGVVTVLRYVVAQEVGKAINPLAIRGQVQGGVTQGIGFALYESLQIDAKGEVSEKSLGAYGLPLAVDIPCVEMILTENPSSSGPYGAKGAAEPPIVLPAAVIACAVSEAIGCPIRNFPITPEAVLSAIMEGERNA